MDVRIEAGRISAAKLIQKGLLIAAVPDVITNVIGVGQSEHNEVMPFAVAESARAGRLCLFMFRLAVNDRGGGFARVFADTFPNAHHVAAGGIQDLAAALL